MTKLSNGKSKLAVVGLMVAAALALPLSASAHGWHGHGYHGGYYHGGYHGYRGGYHHGGHWSGGRWIAGAIVAGAVVGLVDDALRPAPVYYGPPAVVYREPTTVIYEDAPVVRRRVVETRTVYEDGYPTRYVRDDDYDGD